MAHAINLREITLIWKYFMPSHRGTTPGIRSLFTEFKLVDTPVKWIQLQGNAVVSVTSISLVKHGS